MDSISEHCATTSANDITGLVTLRCPAAEANEATGFVVLTQASLTVDDEVYNIPLTENGNHNFGPVYLVKSCWFWYYSTFHCYLTNNVQSWTN